MISAMEPTDLVDNMVVWYGHHVTRHVFEEYLKTYIELAKPDFWPMLLYKALFTREKTEEFLSVVKSHNIVVCG